MQAKLVCKKRTSHGKNEAGRLRRQGTIPGNLLSSGKAESISFDESEFLRLLNAGLKRSSLIDVDVEGGDQGTRALVKEVQRHPVTGKILHIDFYKVQTGKRILVEVPIMTEGLAKGVKGGGALETYINNLKVKATPETLIDFIKVDVTNMDVGDAVKVSELDIPKDWDVQARPEAIVLKVARSRMTAEEPAPGAAAGAEAKPAS